jgi:sulfur carrier protein ThiS adenylyltransferase
MNDFNQYAAYFILPRQGKQKSDLTKVLIFVFKMSWLMKYSQIKEHLSSFRVGIAGAGGLGSNCAVALARSGVGALVIADFDIVEEINLNRQFYFINQVGMNKTEALRDNIKMINPSIQLEMHNLKLTPENIPSVFAGCDVIVEAFDEAEMKEMIIVTVQTAMGGVPLVVGSGMAGWGNTELLKSRKLDDFLYVCGDESTESSDEVPPLAPRVGIVSHMQADVVIGILMNSSKRR